MTESVARTKRVRIAAAITVIAVLAIGAGFFIPRWYAQAQNDAAPPPLSIPTADAEPSAASTATASQVDGTWSVGAGSQAGYRIDEVLNGTTLTVVGRTEKVTGQVTLADGQLTAGTVEVQADAIATDNPRRDNYFRGTALRTAQFPTASFAITAPIAIPEPKQQPSRVEVPGRLTLAGQTREVTGTLEFARDGDSVSASGSIPVDVRDFGIEPPNLGFVAVEPAGQVEFLLKLTR